MFRRITLWLAFALALLVAWRLTGMLMDLALLMIIIGALALCRYLPFRSKK